MWLLSVISTVAHCTLPLFPTRLLVLTFTTFPVVCCCSFSPFPGVGVVICMKCCRNYQCWHAGRVARDFTRLIFPSRCDLDLGTTAEAGTLDQTQAISRLTIKESNYCPASFHRPLSGYCCCRPCSLQVFMGLKVHWHVHWHVYIACHVFTPCWGRGTTRKSPPFFYHCRHRKYQEVFKLTILPYRSHALI